MIERYQELFAMGALPGVDAALAERFGQERGTDLFLQIGARAEEVLRDYELLANTAMQGHLRRSIAPMIGSYLALAESGMDKEEARIFLETEFFKAAKRKQAVLRDMTKRDDFYEFFFSFGKQTMLNDYPAEYWDTKLVCDEDRKVAYDICKCIYWEATQRYGCPELCKTFCDSDYIAMDGVNPKIIFTRTQTLGTGGTCCDFCFTANIQE